METLKVGDLVEPTDACLQWCYDSGIKPPAFTVAPITHAFKDGHVKVGDVLWHSSNFRKVGLQGTTADVAILDDLQGEFSEFAIIEELTAYVRKTYGEHYAKDGVQAFALIAKRPERGLAFALGNVIKYSDRFGQKGGNNRADLLKVAHYSILALHCAAKLEATA